MKELFYAILLKLRYKKQVEPEVPKTFQDITHALNKYTHDLLDKGVIPSKDEIESIKAMLEIAYQLSTRKDK